MKFFINSRFLICILYLILIIGCSKENTTAPDISISYPPDNSTFSAIDTITVKFSVKDPKLVTTAYITIIDENNVQVSQPLSMNINQQSATVNMRYVINNIHLSSGTYYLEVNANDKSGNSKSFVSIYIDAIPQKLMKIYLFSKSQGNMTKVYNVDSTNNLNYLFTFNDALQGSVSNSYFQQLSLLGKNFGKLLTYSASTNSLSWEIDNINNVLFPYDGITRQLDNFIYVSYGTGYVKEFDNYGNIIRSANIGSNNYSAVNFIKFSNRIVAFIMPHNNQSPEISVMDYTTGAYLYNYPLNIHLVEMFDYDDGNIILWGNINDSIHAFTYNIVYSTVQEIRHFPGDKLSSVVKVGDNDYIASIGSSLYDFYGPSGSLILFRQSMPCQRLMFEEIGSNIFAINGTEISVFHYPDGLYQGNIQCNDSIADISFLYNK